MLEPEGLTEAAGRSLELAEARLVAQFAGKAEAAEIRNTLLCAYQELHRQATVLDFLPVLAERLAGHRLAAARHRQSAPQPADLLTADSPPIANDVATLSP